MPEKSGICNTFLLFESLHSYYLVPLSTRLHVSSSNFNNISSVLSLSRFSANTSSWIWKGHIQVASKCRSCCVCDIPCDEGNTMTHHGREAARVKQQFQHLATHFLEHAQHGVLCLLPHLAENTCKSGAIRQCSRRSLTQLAAMSPSSPSATRPEAGPSHRPVSEAVHRPPRCWHKRGSQHSAMDADTQRAHTVLTQCALTLHIHNIHTQCYDATHSCLSYSCNQECRHKHATGACHTSSRR